MADSYEREKAESVTYTDECVTSTSIYFVCVGKRKRRRKRERERERKLAPGRRLLYDTFFILFSLHSRFYFTGLLFVLLKGWPPPAPAAPQLKSREREREREGKRTVVHRGTECNMSPKTLDKVVDLNNSTATEATAALPLSVFALVENSTRTRANLVGLSAG